jgi:DNA-3-methyladenine glycosylase I
MTTALKRCTWPGQDPLYISYHDHEWGRVTHDDHRLFEMLLLEGAQAGLSWITILRKREAYRAAFDNFDAEKIARYTARKREKLLVDPGIVRNRLKIDAFITNARKYLEVCEEFGGFDPYIWQFTGHRVIDRKPRTMTDIPATTPESDAMSRDLKQRGFKFVGSTICYAYMQACGMVNDHVRICFTRKSR